MNFSTTKHLHSKTTFHRLFLFVLLSFAQLFCSSAESSDKDISSDEAAITSHRRVRRDVVRNPNRRWPGGNIPYKLAVELNYLTKKNFLDVIQKLEQISCVKFVPHSNEPDFVYVLHGDGCNSLVGRAGGKQILSLGYGCHPKGIIMHEVMHTLGFFHEHTRRDRDEHVAIKLDNVRQDGKRQFKKYGYYEGTTLGEPYDADSIMHYENFAFTKNGKQTMYYRMDPKKKLGQRDRLSVIDIRQLNKLYRCSSESKRNRKNKNRNKSKNKITHNLKCHDEPRADFTCFMAKVFGQCRTEESRMRILCPLTCGYCEQCRDSSAYCAFFVDWWYCNTSGIIRQRCQKTCKQC